MKSRRNEKSKSKVNLNNFIKKNVNNNLKETFSELGPNLSKNASFVF